MYYKKTDQLPVEETMTLNPSYGTPSIAKKLHDTLVFKKEHSYNQTELALMEHVTHQRISTLLKSIALKAVRRLQQDNQEQVDILMHHSK